MPYILPVPWCHINASYIVPFKASIIDVIALWIAPRYRQWRDATSLTEHVLGYSCAETIHFQVLFSLERFQGGLLDDEALEA